MICNQTFAMKNWLKQPISKEHTKLRQNYWGIIFTNINEVDNHIYEVCESSCHECSAKDEFENAKKKQYCWESIVNQKEGYGT